MKVCRKLAKISILKPKAKSMFWIFYLSIRATTLFSKLKIMFESHK